MGPLRTALFLTLLVSLALLTVATLRVLERVQAEPFEGSVVAQQQGVPVVAQILGSPNLADSDGDGFLDSVDGCPSTPTVWPTPIGDDDCDGWTTADENVIGTNPNDNCGGDLTWPPNIFNAPPSADTVDIFDLATMAPPVFFSTPGPGSPYSVRLDLTAGSAPGDPIIDIFDVAAMAPPVFFATCTP